MSVSEVLFCVVVNDEGQYSIWAENRPLPAGWKTVGPPAAKNDCFAYIDAHWLDMCPASLRRAMDDLPAR